MALRYDKDNQVDFAPIQNGVYNVKVEKCEERTSKAGNPYFWSQLKITGPTCAGRMVFENITAQRLGVVLESCGVPIQNGQDIEAAQMVGLCGRVRTEQEEYNGKWDAKVKAWIVQSKQEPARPSPAMEHMPQVQQQPVQQPVQQPPASDNSALGDIPF